MAEGAGGKQGTRGRDSREREGEIAGKERER